MNPQYIQQQQQQAQQQPGYFPPPPTSSPFGELNSNIPPNALKGSPMNSQTYPPQKPMQAPPLTNLHQSQAPYYMNNIQPQGKNATCCSRFSWIMFAFSKSGASILGNTQYESTNSPHMMPPPTSQNNMINQMSNMSLGDQQRPPSAVIEV